MDLVVLIASHVAYSMPSDACYLPIEAGALLHTERIKGFTSDGTGLNISRKNPEFCELTALYWGWKNLDCDALGLVHYRRYFGKKGWHPRKSRALAEMRDFERILRDVPVIVPKPRHYWIETNYSQYVHAHHARDLQCTRQVISELYPNYIAAFDTTMRRTYGHRFNMFVMRKDIMDQYCQWLFSILFELEKRIDIREYDANNRRVFGFIGERLLDCYLETNGIAYAEMKVVHLESQHWLQKSFRFLMRKLCYRPET